MCRWSQWDAGTRSFGPDDIARAIEEAASDVVINTAAYTAVDRAEVEPELAYAINAEGAGRVAEACARKTTPLIHISTDYVFDGELARPYRETDIQRRLMSTDSLSLKESAASPMAVEDISSCGLPGSTARLDTTSSSQCCGWRAAGRKSAWSTIRLGIPPTPRISQQVFSR